MKDGFAKIIAKKSSSTPGTSRPNKWTPIAAEAAGIA